MEIQVSVGSVFDQPVDTYVIYVGTGRGRLAGDAAAADAHLGGAIERSRRRGLFSGKAGRFLEFPAPDDLPGRRVVALEVGERPREMTASRLRTLGATLARQLRDLDAGQVALASTASAWRGISAEAAAGALAEGFELGLYRFDRHHTRPADRPTGSVSAVTIVAASERARAQGARGASRGQIMATATNAARDMGNEPANLMTPTLLAERALQIAAQYGLECEVIERAEAERIGMGSYLSVSNGSVEPPKFIVLRYHGATARGSYVGLVGKGITFDSGGISLKPAANMEAMKWDMSGAATVIGAMQAIAQLRPRIDVIAVAPCTENLPSGSATKPGDVVYAMDGQSIEVINTDAEGRLVLADGIAYARQQGATTLINVATLTGAMGVALGNVRIGAFVNDDELWRALEAAGERAGERFWRFPLDDDYNEQIKSKVADIKNTGGRAAGSITAAKFIEAFVGDTPWAHLDIAGVMSVDRDRGEWATGMTGMPLRTMVHYVLERARADRAAPA